MNLPKYLPHPYTQRLRQHYETYYGIPRKQLILEANPTEKLHPDFTRWSLRPTRHDFLDVLHGYRTKR